MSWGFFLYVNWFNPGQVYAFYAILAQWPLALLVQDAAAILAQAAGYAGFLLFVLRVPNNKTEARWRGVERALPFVGVVFALVLLASYGAVFGHPAETVTRVSILVGFVVDAAALAILLTRRRIADAGGLSARALGDLGLPDRPAVVPDRRACLDHDDLRHALGDFTPTRGHHRPALSRERRALPVRVRGAAASAGRERDDPPPPRHDPGPQPQRARAAVASRGRAHPGTSEPAGLGVDRHWAPPPCSRSPACTKARFTSPTAISTGRSTRRSKGSGKPSAKRRRPAEIDRLLADETYDALKLASAASFRLEGPVFARDGNGKGWDRGKTTKIKADEPMLAAGA